MTTVRSLGVIPARYESSRFPGKPLQDIAGKCLLQRVWERSLQVQGLTEVYVATDDDRIRQAAEGFGAKVMMTAVTHRSGSDRAAEVVQRCQAAGQTFDFVANIQGDMPFINPLIVERVINDLAKSRKKFDIGTLAVPIDSAAELLRSACAKVVVGKGGQALYFSRAPIPFVRSAENGVAADRNGFGLRHIGLYIYRPESLLRLTKLPEGILEGKERLEQLRALENGMTIKVTTVERQLLEPNIEIDTPEDLQRALEYCRKSE